MTTAFLRGQGRESGGAMAQPTAVKEAQQAGEDKGAAWGYFRTIVVVAHL